MISNDLTYLASFLAVSISGTMTYMSDKEPEEYDLETPSAILVWATRRSSENKIGI